MKASRGLLLNLPQEVQIELTSRCNLKCPFCFQASGGEELTKGEVFKIIDEVADAGIKGVRFSGGETLLRKDLLEILQYAKSRNLTTILNTNGLLITAENLQLFWQVDYLLVSFHDINEAKKKEGIFRRLSEFPLYLMCGTIATRENIRNLRKFYSFLETQPVDEWFLLRPVPAKNQNWITTADARALVRKIAVLNREYRIRTHLANALPFCVDEPGETAKVCVGAKNDNGNTRIVVDASGSIRPSYYSRTVLGRALKDSILDCWKSIKRRVPGLCESCGYAERCGGGILFDEAGERPQDPLFAGA